MRAVFYGQDSENSSLSGNVALYDGSTAEAATTRTSPHRTNSTVATRLLRKSLLRNNLSEYGLFPVVLGGVFAAGIKSELFLVF
jgi:hypothetical protein